jgi:hypothetical protein
LQGLTSSRREKDEVNKERYRDTEARIRESPRTNPEIQSQAYQDGPAEQCKDQARQHAKQPSREVCACDFGHGRTASEPCWQRYNRNVL